MSTTWFEGRDSFFLGAQAFLMEEDREMASTWASPFVQPNPAHRFILGRFVEADRANNNKQLFTLEGLQMARPSITHAPMNMNHSARRVVGAYVATEMIYPTVTEDEEESAAEDNQKLNPYIEALGVFWRHYFRDEYDLVSAAHAEGRLYYSMECVPQRLQCAGVAGCGEEYAYAGRISNTYCEHLNKNLSDKLLVEPHFTAGAVLVPPVNPGWSAANVHSLVAQHAELAERIYDGVAADLAHLSAKQWEALMAELLVIATS